jgi:hypothetical protein
MVQSKRFVLREVDIKPLVTSLGGCIATDMITVHGHLVGIMYREDPKEEGDSGWRFSAGCETQEYMDDIENLAIYDVNTIANYDPGIIPFLSAPSGSAFERDEDSGEFQKVDLDLDLDFDVDLELSNQTE